MRYSFRSLARPLAGLSIALAVPSAVSAQSIMTFTPIACATGGHSFAGNTYSESGFTIFTSASGFGDELATWCADSPNYGGPGMFLNYIGSTGDLTKDGGGTFSINSIWLAHVFGGQSPAGSFTFTGNLAGGGTVSQTFTIGPQVEGNPIFMPFFFDAAWTNLLSVTFASQDSPYYQFTNIFLDDATAIPEPASVALLGTGLIGVFGLGAVRRRRRNGSA